MKSKRTVLKLWVRVLLFLVIVLIFISGIRIIYRGFELKRKSTQKEVIYTYHIDQQVDYKVNLNKNSFIEVPYLEKNETYITDLIKNMDLNFQYYFSGSREIPLHYTYQVLANIKGEYTLQTGEEKSKVWNKESVLIEETTKDSQNQVIIKESIPLDFNTYNEEVKQFRKELNLPISANLNIIMKVKVIGELENTLEDEQTITLKIPLNEQAFRIKEEITPQVDQKIYKKDEYVGTIKNKNLVLGIILIIISIFLLIVFFREIFNIQRKNYYTLQLNKILKSYGDVIVEVKTPLRLEDYHIIEVKNFNEMIDLEEELHIPITFYETIDFYEGEFYLIQGNIMYLYRLTNEN